MTEPIKLKAKEVAETRLKLFREQGGMCPLCKTLIKDGTGCLDHDHSRTGSNAGGVREVLCRNCNGMEGKTNTCATRAQREIGKIQWLRNVVEYWEKHETNQTGLIHPTHKDK